MNELLHGISSTSPFSKNVSAIEMSSESEIDLSKICRTCLRETEDNDLGNEDLCIISKTGKLVRICEMFEAATGLKISSKDALPHHICSPCLQTVNNSYSFRVQSEKAHRILQTVLSSLKEDEESELVQNTIFKIELPEEEDVEEDVTIHQEKTPENEISDEDDEQQPKIGTSSNKKHSDEPEYEEQPELQEDLPGLISYDELSVEEVSLDNLPDDEDEIMDIDELEELFQHDENYETKTVLNKDSKRVKALQRNKKPSTFVCDFCCCVFPLQRDIIQHYKDEHPEEKPFKCEICLVDFVHIQSMRRHKKTHADCPKQKKCPLCNKLFHRSDDLTRHIRTHTDERPYACSICEKAFKQHTELKDHLLSHTDTKMYKCEPCKKEWRSRNGWYLHMKAHQDGREGRRKQTMIKNFKKMISNMER